jgi:hypothetical protein
MLQIVNKYGDALSAHSVERDSPCTLCHAKWMLTEMSGWCLDGMGGQLQGRWDKLNRWLGFVQGIFWCELVFTIDEMREHNKPTDNTYGTATRAGVVGVPLSLKDTKVKFLS